jgi:O-antigen ligase
MRKKHLILFFLSGIAMCLIVVFNAQINNFVFNIILRLSHDAGRTELMTAGFSLFLSGSIPEILFGIGYGNTGQAAKSIIGNHSFHNAYIMILLNGGIMMMLFFLLIVVSSITNSMKCIRINKNAGIYMLMTIIIALLYMCTQTPIIFCSDLLSFMITSFTFIIPKYYYNSIKSQTKIADNIEL